MGIVSLLSLARIRLGFIPFPRFLESCLDQTRLVQGERSVLDRSETDPVSPPLPSWRRQIKTLSLGLKYCWMIPLFSRWQKQLTNAAVESSLSLWWIWPFSASQLRLCVSEIINHRIIDHRSMMNSVFFFVGEEELSKKGWRWSDAGPDEKVANLSLVLVTSSFLLPLYILLSSRSGSLQNGLL